MNKAELAEKIRTLRKRTGLRQEDLAAKAGVSIRVVKDIEAAKGNPTLDSLDLLLSVLGVSFSDVFVNRMKSLSDSIVNAPQSITGDQTKPKREESFVRGSSDDNRTNKGKTDAHGASGKPPHEMPKKVDSVSHASASDTNSNNFSNSRAQLILDIQSKLMLMSDAKLQSILAGESTSDARTSTLSAEDAEYLKLAKVIPLKILKKLVSDWDEVTENYFRAYLGFNSIEGEKKEAEGAASKQKA